MDEIRARIIIQEKGLYIISYDGKENIAEISGHFRFEADLNEELQELQSCK